jgi:TonB family protein
MMDVFTNLTNFATASSICSTSLNSHLLYLYYTMKTAFTTLLFSCIAFAATAQDLKTVKNTLISNPFTEEREEYEVLKSDKKIKHGTYQRFVNGKVVETGFYKNNQKDSTWTKFFSHTGAVREQGNYSKDQRVGLWQFYNYKNQLEQSYDFTERKLILTNPDAISKNGWVITDMDTLQTPVDCTASIIGGSVAYGEILARNIRFPVSAMRKGVSGQVFVTLIVDENGKPSGHKVSKSLDKDCDEEALRVSRLLKDWLPAMKDGKPVKSLHLVPVSFKQEGIINR